MSSISQVCIGFPGFQQLSREEAFQQLLSNACQNSFIKVECTSHGTTATWDTNKKTIMINTSALKREVWIAYLIFELYNATQDKELNQLFQKAQKIQISINDYVKEKELIEHNSTLKTKDFISRYPHIFKENPFQYTFTNFNLHYHYQVLTGHSDSIQQEYLNENPASESFKGCWKNPIEEEDKGVLEEFMNHFYFYIEGQTWPVEKLKQLMQNPRIKKHVNDEFSPYISNLC